jgi:predicted CXXCH cytochrome family protein
VARVFACVCALALAGSLSLLFFTSRASAKVTGHCSNCHTMHNSQGGLPVATDVDGNPVTTAYPSLLVSSCLGCHTSQTNSTIIDLSPGRIPIVNNAIEPARTLAGGNFYYVQVNSSNGHNVIPGSTDPTLTEPPGGSFPQGGHYAGQLRCAGTRGCHGFNGGHQEQPVDNETKAIANAHHGSGIPMDGSTVARSYRFLYGIKGQEDSDWEWDNSNSSHNEYKGSTDTNAKDTISYFCSECHGDLHGAGASSPWVRHPADKVLPTTGEYAQYTQYDMLAPLARPDPSNVSFTNAVTPGQDMVMCLSCHRAHGSPNYKAIRWDYKSPDLETSLSGCAVCHTGKK